MEIIKKLNLNKHPQACDDYSIVCAKNIKLSSDGRNIRNEEGVYNNVAIHNKLVEDFANDYKIVGVIPCNSELVIFVVGSDNEHGAIYRYDEQTDDCYKAYSKFVWEGGEIGGDFTYNVESDLIICFGETNNSSDPYGQLGYGHELRTIKLHRKDDNHLDSDDIDWAKTPLCPEVPYCVCNELNWIEGHAYKGYYEFYIRYKIDDNNYTQWFYINGKPLVDEVNETQIENIPIQHDDAGEGLALTYPLRYGTAFLVTNNNDICNLSLRLNLKFGLCSTIYNTIQIGYIVSSKSYTKAFRSEDITHKINGKNDDYTFRVNHANDIECSVEELTTSYYNYNNVQNIVNYNNRIYIANYIETLKNITKHDLGALGLNLDSAVTLSYRGYADSSVSFDPDSESKPLTQIINNKLDKRNTLLYGEVYDFYIHFVDKYGNVTNGIRLENTKDVSNRFEVFTNSEGHKLFKVPDTLELSYREEIIVYDEYGNPAKAYRTVTSKNPYLALNFQISSIPSPYVAAFISYAKFEKRRKYTGLLLEKKDENGTISKLVNGYINYDDVLNLNANNILKTYEHNTQLQEAKPSSTLRDDYAGMYHKTVLDNLHFINTLDLVTTNDNYFIVNKFVIAANSVKDNNVALESYLKIKTEEDISSIRNPLFYPSTFDLYSLVYINNDLYIKDNKQLVPTTAVAIKYISSGSEYIAHDVDNYTGYNGFWCWDEFILFNPRGFVLNSAEGKIITKDNADEYKDVNSGRPDFVHTITPVPFVAYSINYQWDYPLHIKRFNNPPALQFSIFNPINTSDTEPTTVPMVIVEPKDTIDLFVYPHPNKSEVMSNKYFGEYNPNYPSNIAFNKTVRRSNVIQNESLVNAWRQFPVEGYKLIDENKGDIVKLVAANQLFIVHCEHSIFVFDTSHKLQTIDKDVQLYQPDAFEVDYQELISSDKGYAGLHDRHAAIFDTFGYIFYDRDAQTIYNYSGKQLKTIGAEIQDWIDIWRPTNCRFAVDKFNNRLLVEFNFYSNINADNYYDSLNGQLAGKQTYPNQVTYLTLSYSFLTGTFISLHDYHFDRGYNTKTKTYLTRLDLSYPKDLVEFYKDDHFGEFHECLPKVGGDTHYWHRVGNIFESVVYVIVNTQYEQIKFLEYIKYRLYKYTNPISRSVNSITTNVRSDGGHRDGGWSGDYLLIFNKDCSTGKIDISTDSLNKFNRYKKPYYELSEWNFNYIRQEISSHDNASPSDLHRRIYGNYFALEFIFTNLDNKPIEFETLSCFFSKLRK